jgi:hypothetical protein
MIEWCIFASLDLKFFRYFNIFLIFNVLWNGDSNQSDSGAATKQLAAKKHDESNQSGSKGDSNPSGSGATTKQPAAKKRKENGEQPKW